MPVDPAIMPDRRFNRTRYDADLMISAYVARLQDGTDLDAVRAEEHRSLAPPGQAWTSPTST